MPAQVPERERRAGAAGTAGSASRSSASQYKLMGGSKSDLTKYVNSKVEIKGKLDSAGGAMSSSSSGPTLHVDSVKQISPELHPVVPGQPSVWAGPALVPAPHFF